jgi:hypothetical protein
VENDFTGLISRYIIFFNIFSYPLGTKIPMKYGAAIVIAISLIMSSCTSRLPETEQTIYITKTIEHSSELSATKKPSSTETSTPRPSTPTMPIITVASAAPTFTKTAPPELVTLDCSPAIHLKKIGVNNKPQTPIDLAISDKFAYVLDNEGLWVMDVRDPTHPFELGFIPMQDSKQLIVEGGYAYGIDTQGLWVLDLLNPIDPEFIGFKDTADIPLELSIDQGFAYVRDDHGILRIFDLANPTSLIEVGVYDPPGKILSGEIYGNTISRLRGLAKTNPLSSFSLAGENIYIADLDGGLQVVDISNPRRPTEIGSSPLQISDVEIVGEQAFLFEVGVGQNGDKWVLGITTPSTLDNPTHLGMIQLWWYITPSGNMTISGLCSFISEISRLLMESEGSLPRASVINPRDLMTPLKGVDILGDIVYVADEEEGLVILQMVEADD